MYVCAYVRVYVCMYVCTLLIIGVKHGEPWRDPGSSADKHRFKREPNQFLLSRARETRRPEREKEREREREKWLPIAIFDGRGKKEEGNLS